MNAARACHQPSKWDRYRHWSHTCSGPANAPEADDGAKKNRARSEASLTGDEHQAIAGVFRPCSVSSEKMMEASH
jgi:hypothetical protein